MTNTAEVRVSKHRVNRVTVPPCTKLGAATGETVPCGSCPGSVRLKTFACSVNGRCTVEKAAPGVACCRTCPDRDPPLPVPWTPPVSSRANALPPLRTTRVHGLVASEKDDGFNASILRYQGRLLLAYRSGWEGSQILVAELSEDFQPTRSVPLVIRHQLSRSGREDPRLFVHRGKLHVAFVGFVAAGGKTHMLYARLTDGLEVEHVYAPEYAGRVWPKEKNWSFFEWSGELFAVYSIAPHVVLHVRGDHAYPFAETAVKLPWGGGHLRGGASPVLVGGEFWHWFHGAQDSAGFRRYSVGVVAFEARPPFRPTRISPAPLLWANDSTVPAEQPHKSITFPCGSVLEGGVWTISAGTHDAWVDVHEWPHAEVERSMVNV